MKDFMLSFGRLYKFAAVLISIFTSYSTFSQQTWEQVPTPDPSATRNLLKDISGTSSSDVWVVGEYALNSPADLKNLIMHWNGNNWQVFTGTDVNGSTFSSLWGVTAVNTNDVWATGNYNVPGNTRSQLIHWNGSAWSHIFLPEIMGGSSLFAIDAINANDIWAVGGQAGSPTSPSYTVHYNGTAWAEFPAPSAGIYHNLFEAVDGIASDDVWAVGYQGANYGDFHAMAQHWGGSTWVNIPLPSSVSSPLGELYSVTMISSTDVWAVGSTVTSLVLLIHWDGTSWSEVSSENGAGGAIASREPDIFAVGDRISQWNGNSWSVIDPMNQLSDPSLGSSVTFSNGDIWAAGNSYDTYFHNLVYRTVSNPLPVFISYYAVSKTGNTAIMKWSTASEFNAKEFVMERSADGIVFTPVNSIAAYGSGHNYELVDSSPLHGLNYYRLKGIDQDGGVKIFPIRTLNFDKNDIHLFAVYPNPVQGEVVNVSLPGVGVRNLVLYNQMGQQVRSWMIDSTDSAIPLYLPRGLAKGIYVFALTTGTDVMTEKIFIGE